MAKITQKQVDDAWKVWYKALKAREALDKAREKAREKAHKAWEGAWKLEEKFKAQES